MSRDTARSTWSLPHISSIIQLAQTNKPVVLLSLRFNFSNQPPSLPSDRLPLAPFTEALPPSGGRTPGPRCNSAGPSEMAGRARRSAGASVVRTKALEQCSAEISERGNQGGRDHGHDRT